jgi:hypothetical protein
MKNTIIGIVILILMGASAITTEIFTKKAVIKEQKENCAEKNAIYINQYNKLFDAYVVVTGRARYLISQTLSVKKVKNGEVIYIPTSTMMIDSIINDLNVKISKMPVEFSTITDTIKVKQPTFLDKFKNLFK